MKVTRDFFNERKTGLDIYEWRAEVEGEVFGYRIDVAPGAVSHRIGLRELEREAQRAIADAISDKLFGGRRV